MDNKFASITGSTVATLRRVARPLVVEERCELCNVRIAPAHRHLLEVARRNIVCACDACSMRFHDTVGGRFQLIPRDVHALSALQMSDAQWENFALPINLAFFFHSSVSGKKTAMYPSPAGATESLLPLESWNALVAENPALGQMSPDVEALLVNRVGGAREYFIVPIDVCYELVGLIRTHWRGLSGGDEVWAEIGNFFTRLRGQASPAPNPQEVARA